MGGVINEEELLQEIISQAFDLLSLFQTAEFCFASKRPWNLQNPLSQRLGFPKSHITLALTPLQCHFQPDLHSSGALARHIQPLQGGALPVLNLQVKGPDRALSATEGPYDHPGVALEGTYLKSQYAGACAVKRAAGRPTDTYLGKVLALSIEITLQAAQVTCH